MAQSTSSTKEDKNAIKKEKKEERKALKKLEGSDVSYQAKQAFATDFTNTSAVSWKRTPVFDEVSFTRDGTNQKAYYDADAKLVGTIIPKTFKDLPASAQAHINKKYPDYKKVTVLFFDDNEYNDTDMILFGNQFDDEDNYFTELSNGTRNIILQINMEGNVTFFREMKG